MLVVYLGGDSKEEMGSLTEKSSKMCVKIVTTMGTEAQFCWEIMQHSLLYCSFKRLEVENFIF